MFNKLIIVSSIAILCFAFDYDNIYRNANVWYKVSSDPMNPGEIIALDMSKGYATCDERMIYIVINMVGTVEEVVVVVVTVSSVTTLQFNVH